MSPYVQKMKAKGLVWDTCLEGEEKGWGRREIFKIDRRGSEGHVRVILSVVPNSLRPHGLQPTRLLCPWDFPGKSTGVGCHFLLQGIFPTQGSNLGLLHCRQILTVWAMREEWEGLNSTQGFEGGERVHNLRNMAVPGAKIDRPVDTNMKAGPQS